MKANILATMFAALLFSATAFAQTTYNELEAKGDPNKVQLYKESGKDVQARFDWFRSMRLHPGEEYEPGARLKAWEQAQKLDTYRPTVLTKTGKTVEQKWINLGPRNISGRINGIAIHPQDPATVYFVAADGGVWKSTNSGEDFVPIADDLPTQAYGGIAIDPNNGDNIWVGTGEANGNGTAYAGMGVWKSTDAGATWIRTNYKDPSRVADMKVHNSIGEIVFVAGGPDGLYRTEDGGENWERVRSGTAYSLAMHPTEDSIIYAAFRDQGVLRSTDTGKTWQNISGSWETNPDIALDLSDIRRIAVDVAPSDPNYIYAIMVADGTNNLHGLVRSTDGGETWENARGNLPDNIFAGFGWYMCDIAVKPDDPEFVMISSLRVYSTSNGGESWRSRNASHVDQHAVEYSRANSDVVYIGHDGGIDRSDNGGFTFTNLNDDLPITQFYQLDVSFLEPDIMLGGTQDNGSNLSTGANPDWRHVRGADGMYCAIDYEDPNYMYAEMQNGQQRWRSSDGGNSWKSINDGLSGTGPWVTPFVMHTTDPKTLFTYVGGWLYKTTDRGDNWFKLHERMESNGSIIVISQSKIDPDYMAVSISGSRRVYLSTDAGADWERKAEGLPSRTCSDIFFHPSKLETIYATFSGSSPTPVMISTNLGDEWVTISGDLPGISANAIEVNPMDDDNMYVGTDLGVYTTFDGGETWQKLADGMPNVAVVDLDFHAPSGKLRAATHGRSIYEITVTVPVNLALFNARIEGTSAVLDWSTTQEANLVGFAIERRTGIAERWDEIDFVASKPAAAGRGYYTYTDSELPVGANEAIYRLRFIEGDGSEHYSHEILLSLGGVTPYEFALDQNFPNPFNPVTTIRYTVPQTGDVRLYVTDAKGTTLATLVNEKQLAGSHTTHFSAADVPSGMYFYHLETAGGKLTRKMVVLK